MGSRRTFSVLLLCAAILVAGAVAILDLRAGASANPGGDGSSVVFARSFQDPWSASSGSDFSGIVSFASHRVTVPPDGAGVIVLTATLDAKASHGDVAMIAASVRRPHKFPGQSMKPGNLRIGSSVRKTTTLSWVAKGLRPGATYVVEIDAQAKDVSGNDRARVSGRNLTFRAEAG